MVRLQADITQIVIIVHRLFTGFLGHLRMWDVASHLEHPDSDRLFSHTQMKISIAWTAKAVAQMVSKCDNWAYLAEDSELELIFLRRILEVNNILATTCVAQHCWEDLYCSVPPVVLTGLAAATVND